MNRLGGDDIPGSGNLRRTNKGSADSTTVLYMAHCIKISVIIKTCARLDMVGRHHRCHRG